MRGSQAGDLIEVSKLNQPLFSRPLIGDILGYLRKAEQLTSLVADSVDHDIGPKRRAVLAYARCPGFIATLAFGDLQGLLRASGGTVLFRVEGSKVLADYL